MERHDLPQPEEPRATLRPDQDGAWTRRRMIARAAAIGAGSAVFGRAVAALAAGGPVTAAMIREAEWVSGLDLPEDQRAMMIEGVNGLLADFEKLRAVPLDNAVPPAWRFATTAADDERAARRGTTFEFKPDRHPQHPASDDDLAFAPLSTLAALLRARKVSSVELTNLYLARLRRFDPLLECVVTLTEKLALEQAERADREIRGGQWRGALHGVPWGAKDLLAVAGYPTTWGSKPYQDQVRAETATVARRLADAGAVLVAKLALGELAMGDVWFGGQTRNPWNPAEGSSGSSAGPASATAAGLVGFAVGSETLGSIVSPCTRCGATGLRPTFGRVSRHGAMALSWTMDKLGPLARSAEDCALVFAAIHGADGADPTAVDRPFRWPLERDPRALRVGYVEAAFEEDRTQGVEKEEDRARLREWQAFDRRTLATLRDLGFRPAPVKLPADLPLDSLRFILQAEAATAFDELTRSGRAALMKRQTVNAWPNLFRRGQLIPAVEYIRANRIRTLLMQAMDRLMAQVDVYVCPSYGGGNLLLTNLTGHPAVVLPNGFRSSDGTPTSVTFTGGLFGEAELLAVANAYQQATRYHTQRPPLETSLKSRAQEKKG